MDGQEAAAICLGEVSDSREEKGGWLVGWEGEGSSQELGAQRGWGGGVEGAPAGARQGGSCVLP